ncbi:MULTISPECIES: hypothetical protein [Burkholderia]|nr:MULTISPECIES: hypothetical protein [Burkholderia]
MQLVFTSHEIRKAVHSIPSLLELLPRSQLAPKQAGRADAALLLRNRC